MGSGRGRTVGLTALLVVLAATAVSVALPPGAMAEGGEIAISSQDVTSDFPNNITFRITASGPDPIEEVRVFLTPVGSRQRTYGYLEMERGEEVTGEYVMTTGKGATYSPPGTLFSYYFEIRDAAGRKFRSEDRLYRYMDNREDEDTGIRREWEDLSDGIITVHYYPDYIEFRAKDVLETVTKTQQIMEPVLGIDPTEPIRIVAYPNYADMTGALPFRAAAVRQDLQTQGQAWPSERVLLALISGETFTGIVSHEFTHILIAEAAGAGYSRVPAWLNEGLSEYGNIDKTEDYDRALYYAIFTRRLKPLWYQDVLGGTPDDIVIGYGQGKSVVEFLIGGYGKEKMAELMRAFRNALSADQALQRVYGFDQYGLDTLWRQSLGLDPLPPPGELARRLTPSATSPAAAEPTESPTPQAQATPAAVAEATQEAPAVSDEKPRPSRGCSAPAGHAGSLPVDFAIVALMGGPLLALNLRWGLRSRLRRGLRRFRHATRRS